MTTPARTRIGLHTAVSVVVGSIIGSGIFMKPATMAAQTGSGWALVLVWIAGGLLSLCGALIFAELGAMFPATGGLYLYLKKMYGRFVAFLYGWAAFTVINTAAVAAISFVCATYAGYFLPLPSPDAETVQRLAWHIPGIGDIYPLKDAGTKCLAIGMVVFLTALNATSLSASGRLQLLSTLAKVGVFAALIGGIFLSGNGRFDHLTESAPNAPAGMDWLRACMAALTGAFVAYDGWQSIGFMGGEVEKPEKNIPRSILLGVLTAMAIYVLVNLAYSYALPIGVLAASPLVAADAMAAMLGQNSGAIMAAMVVIVTFGAVNGNLMSTARVTMAMGQDRLFFAAAGRTKKENGLPVHALWIHCAWITVLIISGSFDMLADMFVFVTWVFIIVACTGLVVLRKKMPDMARPYKMWGYPWLLILFCLFACYYVYSVVAFEITAYQAGKIPLINSLLGLLITLAGIPFYGLFRYRQPANKPGGPPNR
ncbi:MAG: amino acid permease [Chitinophagaceae bacterium]|nr:amino acid permease [Chitinophagaceae bacterium]